MKRSEINKALKDMHDLIKKVSCITSSILVNGHQKSGKQRERIR